MHQYVYTPKYMMYMKLVAKKAIYIYIHKTIGIWCSINKQVDQYTYI